MPFKSVSVKFNRPRVSALAGIGAVTLMACYAAPVVADENDTFSIVPSTVLIHDSNLFRLSSTVSPQSALGVPSAAEDITYTSLALNFNKAYGQQAFSLQASLDDYRYHNFSYLSYSSVPFNGAWQWTLTPWLHGHLTSSRNQSLYNFADYTGYVQRNLHTDINNHFDVEYEATPSWRPVAALSQGISTNSQVTLGQSDTRTDTAEAGIRYVAPSGNSFTYVNRVGRGRYTNQSEPNYATLVDNSFNTDENEWRLNWALTEKTIVDARLSRYELDNAHFSERNYGGNVGNLNLTWNGSGKSNVVVGFARELGNYQTDLASYTETKRFTVSPYWAITSRTALRAHYDYARTEYLQPIVETTLDNRLDTLRTAALAIEWQPMRSVMVVATLERDTRKSNQYGYDFVSNSLKFAAKIAF